MKLRGRNVRVMPLFTCELCTSAILPASSTKASNRPNNCRHESSFAPLSPKLIVTAVGPGDCRRRESTLARRTTSSICPEVSTSAETMRMICSDSPPDPPPGLFVRVRVIPEAGPTNPYKFVPFIQTEGTDEFCNAPELRSSAKGLFNMPRHLSLNACTSNKLNSRCEFWFAVLAFTVNNRGDGRRGERT